MNLGAKLVSRKPALSPEERGQAVAASWQDDCTEYLHCFMDSMRGGWQLGVPRNSQREVGGTKARPHPNPLPRGEGDIVAASWPGEGARLTLVRGFNARILRGILCPVGPGFSVAGNAVFGMAARAGRHQRLHRQPLGAGGSSPLFWPPPGPSRTAAYPDCDTATVEQHWCGCTAGTAPARPRTNRS